jgi:hypothetical protein
MQQRVRGQGQVARFMVRGCMDVHVHCAYSPREEWSMGVLNECVCAYYMHM